MTRGRRMRGFRRFSREQDGASAVEFALVSTAFISLLIGIWYLAIMLFNNMSLQWAISRAARMAEINKSVTKDAITQAVNSYLSGNGLPNATVTYSSSVSGGLRSATIGASFSQNYDVPLISTFHINFSSNITVPQPS
jgi:Flp pilus assembly protein TadG